MASLIKSVKRGKTTYRVSFFHPAGDRPRQTVWLGKASKCDARERQVLVERLAAAWTPEGTMHERLAEVLRALPPRIHGKLVRVGLAAPLVAPMTLGELTTKFKARTDVKKQTLAAYNQTLNSLLLHFGSQRLVKSITNQDAITWRNSIALEPLSVATQGKRARVAKCLFNTAKKLKLIADNPFAGVHEGSQVNASRIRYVARDKVSVALQHCSDPRLRALLALARFGGLRVPSEPAWLRWSDWSACKTSLQVYAPKTDSTRVVPVCPELQQALEDLRETLSPAEPKMFPRLDGSANLRTPLLRLLARAKLETWPKLWQNLRSSCSNDWAREFGAAAESEWSGHSVQVAVAHYLRPSRHDFERAAGIVA